MESVQQPDERGRELDSFVKPREASAPLVLHFIEHLHVAISKHVAALAVNMNEVMNTRALMRAK